MGDPILWDISRTVGETDLEGDVYHAPDGRNVAAAWRALPLVMNDDGLVLVAGHILDGPCEGRHRALLARRDPA